MLACKRYNDDKKDKPWLVWLHGLLGSQRDWLTVLPFMRDWPSLTLDLPGHGDSLDYNVHSFNDVDKLLNETLRRQNISDYILVGYSLGGRIALYHACYGAALNLRALALEGANLGLHSETEKKQRLQHDALWAERFRRQPLNDVLSEWYKQPVFSDLTQRQREEFIHYRQNNNANCIADMLEATSLGKQPWLGERLHSLIDRKINTLPFCYLCGENDSKFRQIALDNQLPLNIVAQAGHNAHCSNPEGFAQQLILFLKEC